MKRMLVFLITFISCSRPADKPQIHQYFDLSLYVNSLATKLSNEHSLLQKIILNNGDTETIVLDSVNWAEELKPFADAGINKPAWINAYDADTTIGDSTIIEYRATEEDPPVRKLTVCYRQGKPVRVSLYRKKSNIYYQTRGWYEINDNGYSIKASQKVRFMDEVYYNVRGIFLKRGK
jgi:hypothetical protein